MKMVKRTMVVIIAGFMLTVLTACEKEGPAEKAGKAIDEAASDVTEEANKAMDSIEKKIEE